MAICIIDKSVDNKIDNQIDNQIEEVCASFNDIVALTPFWSFSDPSGKTLTEFTVLFNGGSVIADWGDGSSQILTSGVNYNKTFS